MIDFTTIPLYEALPETHVMHYHNELLAEDNKALKRVIAALVIGVLVYWWYQANSADKKSKKMIEN